MFVFMRDLRVGACVWPSGCYLVISLCLLMMICFVLDGVWV